MVPDERANDPRTLAITKCRTENCRLEWLLSISQRSVAMTASLNLRVHRGDVTEGGKWGATAIDLVFSITYKLMAF